MRVSLSWLQLLMAYAGLLLMFLARSTASEGFENEQRVKSDAKDLEIPIEREGFIAP